MEPSQLDSAATSPPPPQFVIVQELIKEPISEVPESYIRIDHDPNKRVTNDCESTVIGPPSTIPTISMDNLLSDDETVSSDEFQKLHSTCKDWGIFQLVSHGISSSFLAKLRHEIEAFFKLPLHDKLKYGVRAGDFEGYGNVARPGNKFDWGDRFFMIINPLARRKPHLLPELPPSLREAMESYIKETQKIAIKLLVILGKCLGIKMEEIEDLFGGGEEGFQTLRMTYYPPCPQPELVVGLTPHSDGTAITILNQVNPVDGLQILRDGVWSPVSIRPDAFIVNVGDIMEILSNGTYNSIEHRATVNSDKERISIAVFFNPKLEAEIGPSPSIVNPNNPAAFRRLKTEDYVNGFFAQKLNGKSYLEKMRIIDNNTGMKS